MAERSLGRTRGLLAYRWIAAMWVRSTLVYPASFAMMTVGSFVVTGLDFVGIWIMFATVDALGGFGITEIALLYGATGIALGFADLLTGNVERLGHLVRTGTLDAMMVRPVPLLVQVCADHFALRRLARVAQAGSAFAFGSWYVEWSLAKVLVAVAMVAVGTTIFFCLFVAFSSIQFWTADAREAANAFTYGGNTLTQYPLTIFPAEVARGLTLVVPLAFVNWYPCLYLLDRHDPFGAPDWLRLAGPLAATITVVLTAAVWRTGVRHYRSTGS